MIPKPSLLSESDVTAGYVIVADDAFPLKETILKPYNRNALTDQQRNFNYLGQGGWWKMLLAYYVTDFKYS